MLELRPSCENCDVPLPPDSTNAMICTYECTFCAVCVETILENVCPNCGGGIEKRPVRPKAQLVKNPPSTNKVYKPIDEAKFGELKTKNIPIKPEDR